MKEIDQIVKSTVDPFFKDLGFKKKGNTYHRAVNDVVQLFDIQRSKWNSSEGSSFTFNLGVLLPVIHRALGKQIPTAPRIYDADIWTRFGLISHGNDYWYEITPTMNVLELQEQLDSDLHIYVPKFYEKYISVESTAAAVDDDGENSTHMSKVVRFQLLLFVKRTEEATRLIRDEYAKALIPRSSSAVLRRPDGTTEETISSPTVNTGYVSLLEKMASDAGIPLK